MANFVVEDGTVVSGANAYVTLAFVDTYHDDRGRTQWSCFASGVKKAAIVRASTYIDARFGNQFRGVRRTKQQELEWPRIDGFTNSDFSLTGVDDIPRPLQRATAEYALEAIREGELAPPPPKPVQSLDYSDSVTQSGDITTGQIKSKTSKVGSLESSKTYVTPAELVRVSNKRTTSTLVESFNIREVPSADMEIEKILEPSGSRSLIRGD